LWDEETAAVFSRIAAEADSLDVLVNAAWGGYERMVERPRHMAWSRLEEIKSLTCYVGKESWFGYVVFEFTRSSGVVLECPFEGHATNILWGDWKAMVGHTKSEIRDEFADRYTKVVHKGAWLGRIREAPWGS
jgi:hypothetical protein